MRELIYSDKKYINETTKAIQRSLEAQQYLLDTWNGLKLPPLKSLFELVHTPQRVYARAVNNAPEGSYQAMLDVPIPNELYVQAREARKCIQSGRPALWSISDDGKTVLLNKENAEALIHVNDVYIENEKQREFALHCINYIEAGNYLFEKLQGMVTMKGPFMVPFSQTGRAFSFINALDLEPTALREMLKMIQ